MSKRIRSFAFILAMMVAAIFVGGCINLPGNTDASPSPALSDLPTDDAGEGNNKTSVGIRPANGTGYMTVGEAEAAYIASVNSFAAALVEKMDADWTGVISPFSFGILLEMLANGGSEEIQTDILKAMLLSLDMDATNENAARLVTALCDINVGMGMGMGMISNDGKTDVLPSKFTMNGAILVSNENSFSESFEKRMADYFMASVGNIDFKNPAEALEIINGWVKDNTNGLVDSLFSSIDADTEMALLNAIHFNAAWKKPFTAYRDNGEFTGLSGSTMTTMLAASDKYDYAEMNGNQIVLVPYADEAYYMALVLPAKGTSPAAALAGSIDKFSDCAPASVSIRMPAVSLSTNLDGMKLLRQLGLDSIADSTALFPNIVESGNIRLTQLVHGAALNVTEFGTEASGATGATGTKDAPAPADIELVFNRPYAMAIVHAATGAVLFVSVVNDIPNAQ